MASTNRTKFEEVYDISDFHKQHTTLYYPKSLGMEGKEPIPIPFALVKKIIITYFDIYFNELYFLNKPMYFLFTGYLQVVSIISNYNKVSKTYKPESLALFWGERISFIFAYYANIIKLTGKTNKLPIIEKMVLKNNGIAKFPKFDPISYKKKLWFPDWSALKKSSNT